MDLSNIFKDFIKLLLIILNCQILQCLPKQSSRPSTITQITNTIARTTFKPKVTRKKKEKVGMVIKEFPLRNLMDIGLTSNEANTFIRAHNMKGKPLEQQYERTRESDMREIEKRILKDTEDFRTLVKLSKINTNIKKRNLKKTVVKRHASKKRIVINRNSLSLGHLLNH